MSAHTARVGVAGGDWISIRCGRPALTVAANMSTNIMVKNIINFRIHDSFVGNLVNAAGLHMVLWEWVLPHSDGMTGRDTKPVSQRTATVEPSNSRIVPLLTDASRYSSVIANQRNSNRVARRDGTLTLT
jgi:hypothetical protein